MRRRDKIKKEIADIFDLPRDVVLDLPRITIIGSIQLFIENHRGITLYEKNKIQVSVAKGEIVVHGEDLQVRSISMDDIYIEGAIKQIFLERVP